ncbi:MAG: hypothetical protein WD767_11590 [Alphaproteobacteria bacterium]
MPKFLTLVVAGFLLAACTTAAELRPREGGVWIPVSGKSYDEVFKAANKVMARHLHIVEADAELGTVKGVTSQNSYFWNEAAGLYVWPTISNDSGYTVYVDSIAGSLYYQGVRDWKTIILDDLKKELGAV